MSLRSRTRMTWTSKQNWRPEPFDWERILLAARLALRRRLRSLSERRRPLLLYTQAHDAELGTACSKAHDQHPFVALVHLSKHADFASTVFILMPYFSDMHVLDELCHFAQDMEKGGRSLVTNVILSQTGTSSPHQATSLARVDKTIG